MSIFRYLTVSLLLSVALTYAAPPKSGKVRLVIGDVTFQKGGQSKWQPLRVDAKVKEKDRIKTASESTASIAFPDGSIVAVAELSEVEFAQLLFADGSQISMIDVKQGQLRFDAQKQKPGSSFKFKTGTATCSIRGTDGVVGVTKSGQAVGSLNSGLMDMEQDGQKVEVKANQFVAFRKGKPPIIGEAKNAGDPEFMKKVAEVVDDTTKSDADIIAAAKALDKEIEGNKAKLQSKYSCKFSKIPPVISMNAVRIEATCTEGMEVTISAETQKSKGSRLIFTPSWEKGAFGEKKFIATCLANDKMFECGRLSTLYKIDRKASFGKSDQDKCTVDYTTEGFDENRGSLKFSKGDSLIQELVLDVDASGSFNLIPGNHTYTLEAVNEGSDVGKVKKSFKCYPSTEVFIEFKGGDEEVVYRKVSQGAFAYPEVEFFLRNVAGNDPSQVKSVKVTSGGKAVPVKLAPSTGSWLTYQGKLRLPRNKITTIFVDVEMQNGKKLSGTKTFELR